MGSKTPTKKRAPTLGTIIDSLWALREEKRSLEKKITAIEEIIGVSETSLMETMEKEGVAKATGAKATVSVTETVSSKVEDFEKLSGFIKKTGFFHLLQRRVSDEACRELYEQGKTIPGVEKFVKKRVNIRSLAS
jgi:hypothetical protein